MHLVCYLLSLPLLFVCFLALPSLLTLAINLVAVLIVWNLYPYIFHRNAITWKIVKDAGCVLSLSLLFLLVYFFVLPSLLLSSTSIAFILVSYKAQPRCKPIVQWEISCPKTKQWVLSMPWIHISHFQGREGEFTPPQQYSPFIHTIYHRLRVDF